MDCLPVLGQLTLGLVRSARFFGGVFPSYKSPMLCFSIRAVFQDNGGRRVMRPTAFIAEAKDTIPSR
jgi:hypothetical protein